MADWLFPALCLVAKFALPGCTEADAAFGFFRLRFRCRSGCQLSQFMKDNSNRPVMTIHLFSQFFDLPRQRPIDVQNAAKLDKGINNLDAGSYCPF